MAGRRRRALVVVVLLVPLALVMVASNPPVGHHEAALWATIPPGVAEKAAEHGVTYLGSESMSFHDLGVLSFTMMRGHGLKSLGAFGRVWVNH